MPSGCAACSSPAAGRWAWCNARASAGKLSRMGRVICAGRFKSRSAAQARNTFKASRRPSSVPGGVVARGQRFQVGVAPQGQRVGRAAVEVVRLAARCLRVAPCCGGRAIQRRQCLWVRPWLRCVLRLRWCFGGAFLMCDSVTPSGSPQVVGCQWRKGWRAGFATPRQVPVLPRHPRLKTRQVGFVVVRADLSTFNQTDVGDGLRRVQVKQHFINERLPKRPCRMARYSRSTSRSRWTRTCVRLHPQALRNSRRLKVSVALGLAFLTSSRM